MNQKFLRDPKNAFDIKHQREASQKVNALLNAKIVDANGNIIGDVLYADGNTVFQIRASSGSINAQFRGEYFTGAAYLIGDLVTVATGANAGTYICVKDSPSIAPWTGGGYWIKLPSGNALGQWM